MHNSGIKIINRDNKMITLEELFRGKDETRKKMAQLSFAEKIRMLVSLQETARKWGGKKDVITWKL